MSHVTLRRVLGALAALVVAAVLAAAPTPAVEGFALTRVAGADRYATAAQAALDAFGTAEAAVLARGDAFPDALAGSYLTGVLGAPVLLTTPDDLPEVTATALDTLGVDTVYLLGGTAAISEPVADEAAGTGETPRTIERVAGVNRYATAAEIATGQDAASIGEIDGARTAVLASGESFADALAAGPLAHANRLPILLTPSGSLAPEARDAIESLGIEHLVVVGGTAAVADSVVDAATSGDVTAERVAGVNRYATAVEVADFALGTTGADDSAVDLATGQQFADALAAGPAAGAANRPLLLTTSASLSGETGAWLEAHAGTLAGGRVFGGTSAVSDATVAAAEEAAGGEAEGPAEGQLTAINAAGDTYRFVADDATAGSAVTYTGTDTFTVDGDTATVGGFETAATPGDRIRHTPAAGGSPARHELTNVDPASITSGTVGNVDIANQQLDIINPVNGDALRTDLAYDGVLYRVGGSAATEESFEADVNEGDELAITGIGAQRTFELTNAAVDGVANDIAPGANPLLPTTDLKIGALGDDPATDADETFQANGSQLATDVFQVDGQESDYDGFAEALSQGDAVTYTRTGEVETFALVNLTPSTIDGQAVEGITTTTGVIPPEDAGGSFTMVTEDGPVDVAYEGGGAFVVDGAVASEAELEAAYTAGDLITYRAADAPSGTTQRLELVNRTLEGTVDPESVNTADLAPPGGAAANSYGVLGQDGATVLRQVTYVAEDASANTYFVNGTSVTLEAFEAELDAIAAGTRAGTARVETAGEVTQHRLTTTAAS